MGFEKSYNKFKEFSYKWRAKYFQPILKLLAKLKITPNQITTFRLIFILPLAYCFYTCNFWGIFFSYLIFWIVDLFDGSLARYLNITNDKGGFLDSLTDHFMYSVLILGFIYLQVADAVLLAYNIVIQLLVSILANVKKWQKGESDWLIKIKSNAPYFKNWTHFFLLLYLFGFNYLNPIFFILNIWMTITSLYYFSAIKKRN